LSTVDSTICSVPPKVSASILSPAASAAMAATVAATALFWCYCCCCSWKMTAS
jgi:hypothetical protein